MMYAVQQVRGVFVVLLAGGIRAVRRVNYAEVNGDTVTRFVRIPEKLRCTFGVDLGVFL